MQFSTDPNIWVIYGLVFLLGLLVGLFLTAGGRRKWRTRYEDEVTRRKELEAQYEENEREWRERDSLRAAALKDSKRTRTDRDGDGIDDRVEGTVDARLGAIDEGSANLVDRDGDGLADRREP